MKKETRFSAKCERFIKLIIQLLPFLVLFVYFISFVGVYWNDNLLTFDYNQDNFDIFIGNFFAGFFESLLSYVDYHSWFWVFNLEDFIPNFFNYLGILNNEYTILFDFTFCYIGYLVFVEIIWLIKNVLVFLPKIGNYFISKWSGD